MAPVSDLELADVQTERGTFHLGPVKFEVPAGSATVVLGPSGAGKTTLLRAIAGFLTLTGGRVRLDGGRVDTLPPERRGFGFVPPNLGLFPQRRVRQNVRYPLSLRGAQDADRKTEEWIGRFGLEALADRFPHELSSGQRQRVAMARALAAEPRALLWDEPLAALDVDSRDTLVRLLRDLLETERLPLLLVTHDPTTAFALASRLVILHAGQVRVDRTPEALARGPLDRFVARFLGFENLFTPVELATAREATLSPQLAASAGPGGLAVPPEAVLWRFGDNGPHRARVAALRWTAAGWVVALRHGSLTFHTLAPGAVPGCRVGDRVTIDVDPTVLKPLVGIPAEEER
jgi:ABC-type Fe3+/spermidine/putrescine transport system ATPase subunit